MRGKSVFKGLVKISLGVSALAGGLAFVKERLEAGCSSHTPYGIYEKYIKRPLDAALATGALVALSPVFLATAALVRCRLGSPVLFCQERPGREETIFRLFKFRSMTDRKDEKGRLLPDDDRLTPFGRTLRATSIDELPELLNIVKGDMSLVGPRPLLKEYLPYYTETEKHRHDVRPGLSGLAQVHGRNTITWEEKFAKDLEYVGKITFLGDLKIILETIVKTLKRADVRVGREHVAGRLDVARGCRKAEEMGEEAVGMQNEKE